jgi:hypothetical protein
MRYAMLTHPCVLESGGKGVILISRRTRKKVTLDAPLYYNPIKRYCDLKMWQEVFKERNSVLKSCNHDTIISQKSDILLI